jgi:hypothetical protein
MKSFLFYTIILFLLTSCKNPTAEYSDNNLKQDIEHTIQMSIKLEEGTIITTSTDLCSPFPEHVEVLSSNSYIIIKPLNLVYTKW